MVPREVFHGSRWLNDMRFYSPMICLADGTHIFVGDCVDCRYLQLEVVNCLVIKFYMKVSHCSHNYYSLVLRMTSRK